MIPFRDHNRSRRFPILTALLVTINVIVWLYMWMLSATGGLQAFAERWAVIPYNLTHSPSLRDLLTIVTAMFMHGSWAHIIGNMLYLWIFGDNIEDVLGRPLYLLFYFVGGLAATVLQVAVAPNTRVPNLGASGAIAAVLGGYLVLFPQARIDTLVFLGYFIRIIALPALYVLGFWFVIQLFSGLGTLGMSAARGGVAYFAHVGGFAAGLMMMALYKAATGGPRRERA